jgi:hypothetical protein
MDEIERHVAEAGWNTEGATKDSVDELWRQKADGPKVSSPMYPPTHSGYIPSPEENAVEPEPHLSDSTFILMNPDDMRSGDLHAINGRLDDALNVYRRNLSTSTSLVEKAPNDSDAKARRHEALAKISDLAFQYILARKNGTAFECAEEATCHEPESPRHALILAHVHMCLGHVTQAKQIYYQHRDDRLEDGTTWKSRLTEDFAEMRKAGLKHGLMDRIEREFGLR